MKREYYVTDRDELQELEEKFNLTDYGMSGTIPGWHWLQDDSAELTVYYKFND